MEADSLSVSEALCRMQSAIKRGEIDEAVLFGRRTHRSLSLSDEDVTFGPLLCEGAESRVFQGTFGPHSVAIKKPILRTSFDLERFRGEIEILFKMNHPSIVSILGARMLPPNYYLVMPFEGKSFHSLLYDDGGRTNWKRTLEIGLQLTSAMQHVHDHGILHRDLKTRNVMIGKDGVAKLIDFGIAKSMELVATEAQKQPSGGFHKKRMMGTLEYMAPEVLQNQGHSSASDVYAFAILLNEMMTGIYPFSDCNKENPDAHTVLEMGYGRKELAAAVAAEGLRPTLPKDAPLEYVDIISKCWSLYPSKRPTFAQIHDHLFSIWTKLDTIAIPLGISSKKSSYSCLPLQKKIEIDSFEADSKNGGWSKVSEGTEFTVTLSCGSFQTAGHRGEDKMEDRHLIVTPFLESESNALFGRAFAMSSRRDLFFEVSLMDIVDPKQRNSLWNTFMISFGRNYRKQTQLKMLLFRPFTKLKRSSKPLKILVSTNHAACAFQDAPPLPLWFSKTNSLSPTQVSTLFPTSR